MPSHIVVNSLGLTYKGTIGISIATIPDVCKTPSPGGPIPLPYPNFANQGTLRNGTTTVFAKGGKMIAVKGSQYGMSSGDEPGTVGGVKSNTFKQATDWITYSFDVKMDGKNACRHTDKKFHNNKNTVNLAGNGDPVMPANLSRQDRVLWKECVKQHKKYKNLHSIESNYKRNQIRNLRQIARQTANNHHATQELKKIMGAKIIRSEEILQERIKYIDMECDKFDYFQQGTTEQERRDAHHGEVAHVRRYIRNLKNFVDE